MPELRDDPLTGTRVIVASGRATRPDTFRVVTMPRAALVEDCPFCPGHESLTPPEVARTGPGLADGPGWRVRVVPNKYPIVGGGVGGAHEVVILSPAHDRSFAELDDQAAVDAMIALRDRAAGHLAAGLAHVQPFVNHGRAAGASIEHPHAQLVALDFVPPGVSGALARWAAAGTDLLAVSLAASRDAGCVVFERDAVVAWCPVASASPFEVVLADPAAGPDFEGMSGGETANLALALRDLLASLTAALGDVAYNAVFHGAPSGSPGAFRRHVRVSPRVGVTAGFEAGTGVMVNVVEPELAAAALREQLP